MQVQERGAFEIGTKRRADGIMNFEHGKGGTMRAESFGIYEVTRC